MARMGFEIDPSVMTSLEAIAGSEGVTVTEILRRGLSVMMAFREQKRAGRHHLGFVSDPSVLETEMVGILR